MARFKQLKIEIFQEKSKRRGDKADTWRYRFVSPENGQVVATCGEGLVKPHCVQMAAKWANTLRAGGCGIIGLDLLAAEADDEPAEAEAAETLPDLMDE